MQDEWCISLRTIEPIGVYFSVSSCVGVPPRSLLLVLATANLQKLDFNGGFTVLVANCVQNCRLVECLLKIDAI